ncbi:MAG: substrate-binding domain-containing protein [Candidatus Marinimicrobia bacterium]|nr:substrate-binding domain-containing protein [Candidatus Neomarinimicrobiota bacterium]
MKPIIFFSFLFIVLIIYGCHSKKTETIKVSGAWALYPMMCVWADEYQKDHWVKIEVSGGGAGKGISDVLNGQVDIAMVSRLIKKEELEQGAFYLSVTKDAVIATINGKNPVLAEIQEQGVSREDLESIFLKKITRWGELVGKELEHDEIVVYGRADASGAAQVWAAFLGDHTQAELQEKADANFSGDQALCNGVKSVRNAIGFNNLNYAYDIEKGGFAENIRPVPIDLNANGRLDSMENFYNLRQDLVAKVSEGVYPSPPARLEFLVSKGPFNKKSKAFVSWIMHEGQKFITENGYVQLPVTDIQRETQYLISGHRDPYEK